MLVRALVAELVAPFASCAFVPDWQGRAARAVALADYLTLLCKDNPFCDELDEPHRKPCLSRAPLRRITYAAFDAAWDIQSIGYDFPHDVLPEDELDPFSRVFADVDSVEKLAMSACAYAITRTAPPTAAMLILCNILYDEALHLEALSSLLGVDQAKEPWITPKRSRAWELISSCPDLASYAFVEHCLYEGEGTLAAALGTHKLSALGEDSVSYRVAHKIYCEEVNHALTGYSLLKMCDDSLPASFFIEWARAFVATEALGAADTFKGRKRRFALHLASEYARTRSVSRIHAIIRSNAVAVLEKGHLVITDEDLEQSASKMLS